MLGSAAKTDWPKPYVSQAAVRKWREGGGMDVRHAQKIEELTGGKVTATQISDGIRR